MSGLPNFCQVTDSSSAPGPDAFLGADDTVCGSGPAPQLCAVLDREQLWTVSEAEGTLLPSCRFFPGIVECGRFFTQPVERKMRPLSLGSGSVVWSGVIGFQDNRAAFQISHLHLDFHCLLAGFSVFPGEA